MNIPITISARLRSYPSIGVTEEEIFHREIPSTGGFKPYSPIVWQSMGIEIIQATFGEERDQMEWLEDMFCIEMMERFNQMETMNP